MTKLRAEIINGYWWHVAYINGKRIVLQVIGKVGDCLRF